jgi:hypothetical protein
MFNDVWGLTALCATLAIVVLAPGAGEQREAMMTLMAGLVPR